MSNSYLYKFARIVSTIFIPPALTLISFIYLSLHFEEGSERKIFLILIALIFGFILQIISFLYFYKNNLISDVDVTNKLERTLPFLASLLIYIVGFIILIIYKASNISIAFWFCYISNTVLVIFINRFLKISIHAMGVSGYLALFTFILGYQMLLFLPILFLVGWSRIELKCHSLVEVIVGSILGYMLVYFQLNIFLKM